MANPKTFGSDFKRGARAALDLCRKLQDQRQLPESWGKDFTDGYIAGCKECCSMIINELHPKLD